MSRLAVSLALGLLAPPAVAQCLETSFGTALGSPATLIGDVVLPMQPIGFAFPLGGATYTAVHVCDKGYVFLSNANVPPVPTIADYTATAAELGSGGPRVAALWSDVEVLASNNGQIYENSSPTRCVITWHNMTCHAGTCPPFDMQLQLLVTGEVLVFYGPGATNNSVSTFPAWHAGVAGISPGFTTAGAQSDLSAGGSTANAVVVEEWPAANTFDMADRGIHFVPTGSGWLFAQPAGCAAATAFGDGCVEAADSVYEELTSGFDLSNTTITWLRTGSGYTMLTGGPGTLLMPSAAAIHIAPGATDGEQVVMLSAPMPAPFGTTSSLNITTKGQVELATWTNGFVDFTPTVAELLAWSRTAFHCWHDFDQTDPGSGPILFEEVGGIACATWNGVHSFASSTPSTFQFQLDLASGNVTLVMGAMNGAANPDVIVVGYSIAGTSFDPGATDLSALTGAVDLFDVAIAPLQLRTTGLPRLGSTTFSLDTSNVSNLVPLGFLFVGDTVVSPGLDLTSLGMPGCFAWTNANVGSIGFPVALPAGTGSVPLPIPNNSGLGGAVLTAQAIAFSLSTPSNLVSSNGMRLELGN